MSTARAPIRAPIHPRISNPQRARKRVQRKPELSQAVVELAAGANPLTLDDAKQRLRLNLEGSDADIDADIQRALDGGLQQVQQDSNRSLAVGRQLQQTQSRLVSPLPLFYPPARSVVSLEYYDLDNTLQAIDATKYNLIKFGTASCLLEIESQPSTYDRLDAVRVVFEAGYADAAAVPANLQLAILNRCEAFFQNDLEAAEQKALDDEYKRFIAATQVV